jgi:hypothetical protein
MRPARLFLPAAAIVAALAAAGCATEYPTTASAAPGAGRQCFYPRDVNGFRAVDDTTINLQVGVNDIYQAKLFAPCNDARFTEGLAIRHTGGATSAVCSGLDAEFIVPSPTGPHTCAVTSLRKLTPAEVALLAPRDKP